MTLIARCTATLAGDELVLTMADGSVHSRIPVDDTMDPAEALERISDGTMPVRLLWTVDRTGADPDRLALMGGRGDLGDVPVPTVFGTYCVQRP